MYLRLIVLICQGKRLYSSKTGFHLPFLIKRLIFFFFLYNPLEFDCIYLSVCFVFVCFSHVLFSQCYYRLLPHAEFASCNEYTFRF